MVKTYKPTIRLSAIMHLLVEVLNTKLDRHKWAIDNLYIINGIRILCSQGLINKRCTVCEHDGIIEIRIWCWSMAAKHWFADNKYIYQAQLDAYDPLFNLDKTVNLIIEKMEEPL